MRNVTEIQLGPIISHAVDRQRQSLVHDRRPLRLRQRGHIDVLENVEGLHNEAAARRGSKRVNVVTSIARRDVTAIENLVPGQVFERDVTAVFRHIRGNHSRNLAPVEIIGAGIGETRNSPCKRRLSEHVARVIGTAVSFDKNLLKSRVVLEILETVCMAGGSAGGDLVTVSSDSRGLLQQGRPG